jgi:hypothetical protein
VGSPALAIAQCLWWRNRRSFIASAVTIAAMAVLYPLVFSLTHAEWVLAASTLPIICVLAVGWNGLLFVEEHGNLSSHYPRYMLTLPVRTFTLVLWPFVFSTTIVSLLWVVIAALVYNTSGFAVPILAPALGCAAMMGWLQVMSWTPIASEWIRLILTLLWLSILAAFPMYLLTLSERSLAWFGPLFVVYIAAAFPLCFSAVAYERRGNRLRVWPQRLRLQSSALPRVQSRPRRSFRSPFAAQSWYEWNCHGWDVPTYVGGVALMIWTMLLVVVVRGHEVLWMPPIVGLMFGLPVVLAGAVGPGLAKFKPIWIKNGGVMTFVAIRPLTSSQIVFSKFLMAARSALLTWVISLILALSWILLSGKFDAVMTLARGFLDRYSGQRSTAIVALGVVVLLSLTWKQMTDGFAVTLSGRGWIGAVATWIFLAGVTILTSAGLWAVNHPEQLSWLFLIISNCLILGSVIKGAAAIVVFQWVLNRGLMTWRAVAGVLALWLVLTGCGVGLAMLLMLPTPAPAVPISWPVVVLGIGLFTPLVRIPLATLAVEWNRHR